MRFVQLAGWLLGSWLAVTSQAQTIYSIYDDQLNNGFQDWSWGTRNFTNSAPVHSGANSISFSGVTWQAISFWHSDFNVSVYTNLAFWANGGSGGGQVLQIYLQFSNQALSTAAYTLPALPTNAWQQFRIPLSTLGATGITNLSRINFQLTNQGTTNTLYLDDLNLYYPPPALVQMNIQAGQKVRSVDARWFGLNTAVWDTSFDTATTISALQELGTQILRFPGGSLSDEYHWATGRSGTNTWTWGTSFANYMHVATNIGAQMMITVNYGTGTSNEAAAWVRHANITNHLAARYWEIGNECYGTWETDSNTLPHDPYTYAVRASTYLSAMRAADPTIKIGVMVIPGENSASNNATHYAINSRTGTTNYGWTPILLATLKSLGATPDFLVHHVYPEYGSDNDLTILQAATNWASDADNLRQQVTDYFSSSGTNIELLCTENNADAGNQGRQSTSLVNGLYLADSVAQLMRTEFNSLIWWDLRNGTDTNGDFSASLYGWRTYGDLGIINGLNTRHPVYYTYKLLAEFARPGDTVIAASTDYTPLPAYAIRKADGSVAVLVINKDNTNTLNAQLALTGFLPWTNAQVRSYGIAQDEATRTNSTMPGAQDIATNQLAISGTNLALTLPPYSATVVFVPPAAPQLVNQPMTNGQFKLLVQGQTSVRYFLQNSTNLHTWTTVATNTLTNTTWLFTTNSTTPASFWRAIWQAQ